MNHAALHTARALARNTPTRLAVPSALRPAAARARARAYTSTADAEPPLERAKVDKQGSTAVPIAAVAAVVGAGVYYVLAPASAPVLSPEDEKSVQEHQVRHYLERCKKTDEIEARHTAELEQEIARLAADKHSREEILAHRRRCEERRAEVQQHEQLLMKHRHDESFPNMRGKTQSFAEKERAAAVELTHQKDAMERLRAKLEGEGVKFSV